jgi:hypothetical protein
MIDKVWAWFTSQGYKGSVYVRNQDSGASGTSHIFTSKGNTPDDDIFIHEAIYEMDPDYRVVAIIKQVGATSAETWAQETYPEGVIEVSFAGDAENIQRNLDNAIIEGLAHKKVLKNRESGAIVKFGYKFEDLLQ